MPKRNGPASDNTTPQRSSRSDKESDNYANLLNQYSQSLDKSADALKAASENFNKTSMSLVKDTEKNNDKLIRAFNEILKAFGKESKELNRMIKDTNETSEDIRNKDVADNLSQYAKVNDAHTEKTRAVGNALIGSFKIAGDYVIKKFTEASHNVISSYNAALSEVVVRQNISNQDYTQKLKDITDEIKDDGLRRQFSQVDFLNSLQTTLSTGLRGDDANRTAYSNLITNKVLPALNTNTTSYTRMSKMFGETFTEGITAVNKYAEKLYGGEGLEQGQADMVLENVYREVAASADSSQDAVNKIQEMQLAYSQYADKYGAEASQDLLNIFKAVSSGDISQLGSQGGLAVAAADAAGIDVGNKNSLTGENFDKFVQEYAKIVMQEMDNGFTATLSGAFGSNVNTINAMIAGEKLGTDVMNLGGAKQGFNSKEEYKQVLSQLGDGWGQNLTDQQTKLNENLVAKFSDTIAGIIPDTDTTLRGIASILGLWWAAWRVRSVKDSGGDSSLLNKILGNESSNIEVGEEVTQTSIGSKLGSILKGRPTGGLATAAGITSIAAGGLWAVADGVSAGKQASENEMSVSQQIGAGVTGALTGSKTVGMTSDQKQAYYAQNGYFDFGEMFQNAGKGALIGGGAGTLGGPLGTVGGSLVGGAVGAVVNATDQIIEAWDYKKLAKASESTIESLSELSTASDNLKATTDKSNEAFDNLQVIQSNLGKTTAESQKAFDELKESYPEYLGNVKDVSQLDESYVKVLQQKIELENIQAMKDAYETMSDVSDSIQDKVDAYDKVTKKEEGSNPYAFQFAQDFDSGLIGLGDDAHLEEGQMTATDWINSKAEELGVDKEVIVKGLQEEGLVTNYNDQNGERNAYGVLKSEKKILKLLDSSGDRDSAAYSNLIDLENNLLDFYLNTLKRSYDTYQKDPESRTSQSAITDLGSNIDEFTEAFNDVVSYAQENAQVETFRAFVNDSMTDLGDIYKLADKTVPQYKIGIDRVFGDNILSLLHKDEAVLTASSAEKLREMSGGSGGISGYIQNLYESQKLKSTAVPSETSVSFDPVIEAISSQTGTLNDSLQSIIELIAQLLPEGTINAPEISKRLLNYSGA